MALISCPECKRQISDKAAACPHCGYPSPARGAQAGGGMQELLSQYEAWQAQIERYCREVSERMETHKREHPVLRPWEMRYDYGELRSFLTDAQASAKTIAQRIGEIRAYMASGKTPNPRQFDFYTQSFRGQVSGLEIAYRTLKGKDFAPRLILGDPTQRPMR